VSADAAFLGAAQPEQEIENMTIHDMTCAAK
jgi:hypothetical protein